MTPTPDDTEARVTDAIANALGALPESRNIFDITDEATTWIDAPVEYLADALAPIVADAVAAARAEGDALRARVEALAYASADGTEYEHNEGCQGEAECPACWSQTIRAALTSGDRS